MSTARVKINRPNDIPKLSKREAEKLLSLSDDQIDCSDIPEIDDHAEYELFNNGYELIEYHKKKKLISLRIEPATLEAIKDKAKKFNTNYQTLINQILNSFVHHSKEERK